MKLPNKVHFVLMNHLVVHLTHKMSKLSMEINHAKFILRNGS